MPIIKPPFFNFQSAADILAYLSGTAAAAFSWNSQALNYLGHLGVGCISRTTHGIEYEETQTITDNLEYFGLAAGLYVQKTSAAYTGVIIGVKGHALVGAGNTQNWTASTSMVGTEGNVETKVGSTGTIANMVSLYARATIADAAIVTQRVGLYVQDVQLTGTKLVNSYGILIDHINSGSGLNYAIYTYTGLTRLGGGLTVVGTTTLDTGLTGVLRSDAGVVSVDTDVTDIVAAASTTVAGKIEIAIASEVNTGTSATLAVSPDALAGSNLGTQGFSVIAVDAATALTVVDGKAYIPVPACMNGMNLIRAQAIVNTAGTTNATTIDIYNVTDGVDMLSGAISIASGETVGTVGTVNGATDDIATNDVLRIDVTTMSTTAPKGLMVVLEFQLP